jgi:hypothetical protein
MIDRLDEVSDERIKTLGEIERDKLRVARVYNKRVKEKSFQVRDLVWKMIFPIGSKSNKFRKWSPNWEGPYRIEEVILQKNLIWFRAYKGPHCQGHLTRSNWKSTILAFGKTLELENGW